MLTLTPNATEPPGQFRAARVRMRRSSLAVCFRAYVAIALCFSFAILVFGCKASLFQPGDGVRCRVAGAECAPRDSAMANPSGNEAPFWRRSMDCADPVDTGGPVFRESLAIAKLTDCAHRRLIPRSPPRTQS